MFEAVELGNRIAKKDYEARLPQLRVDLLNLQFDLQETSRSVLLVLAGVDRLGCEQTVDRANEWLDARHLGTHVFPAPEAFERERPRFWRYWRHLPPRGTMGLYFGGWPINLCAARLEGRLDEAEFLREIAHASRFEQALAADGTVVLKCWLHVPRDVLAKRLEDARKGRRGAWEADDRDWSLLDRWDEALPVAESFIRENGSAEAPWHVIESADERYRELRVFGLVREALEVANQPFEPGNGGMAPPPRIEATSRRTVLDTVDAHARIERSDYHERKDHLQAKLHRLSARADEAGRSSVLVFEGWDAAGKGGTIRRLTHAMPALRYRVIPVGAPNEAERARHYLWRFWSNLPRAGRMMIFDRSWYGRVLVERVEGFARVDEWRRAYDEINDFEAQLVEHGWVVRKYWLEIDAEEQHRRFEARRATPYKKYKYTAEDERNRARRADYVEAVHEMVVRTSTEHAPWRLVPANQKKFARVTVLDDVCAALAHALDDASDGKPGHKHDRTPGGRHDGPPAPRSDG